MERKKKLEIEIVKELVKKQKYDESDLLQKALERANHLELNKAVNSQSFSAELKAEYASLALKGSERNKKEEKRRDKINEAL